MNQTDRVLSNIGAIRTLLENFPMGLFERDGKTYTSAFEFIMDVLKAVGIDPKELLSYLIGKIYGFEGKIAYTIDGLYESISNGDLNVDMQNPFIEGLEYSIKGILMALFTSIFTCSALPILDTELFDYDALEPLMGDDAEKTKRTNDNDKNKLKIPVSSIDLLGMLSISPSTKEGSLYYLTDGTDKYYHKEYVTESKIESAHTQVIAGESYSAITSLYEKEYLVNFEYMFPNMYFEINEHDINTDTIQSAGAPIDLEIKVNYLTGECDSEETTTFKIDKGQDCSEGQTIQSVMIKTGLSGEVYYYPTEIVSITINGNKQGCEVGNEEDGTNSWIYLTATNGEVNNWEESGETIDLEIFGDSRADEKKIVVKTADHTGSYDCEIETTASWYTYKLLEDPKEAQDVIRSTYVPDNVYDTDPEYIVCYEGVNPNLVYRSNDMNAFLWYSLNKGSVVNQQEENHLMWDSRLTAAKKGIVRNGGDWNIWYSSKSEEGGEFEYNENPETEVLYPIIQVERYDEDNFLLRFPSQRYYKPKKRKKIYDGTYEHGSDFGQYFNSSIYRFDWEYLKNIQILNPKLLLVRLLESLIGFAMDTPSSVKFDFNKKRIEAVIAKAIKSIITANDMEIEDCWKSFSNEDYNDLLEEMLLSRYQATRSDDESVRIRVHDVNDYINQLDQINQNTSSQGTTSMITKTVTNVMMTEGSDEKTEYSFDFGFDSNMYQKLIWAIVMPIAESLFTPQVMLLMMINFQMLGIVKIDEALGNDFTKILNLVINKILGLIKSIVIYIKDKILQLLLDLFYEKVMPMLTEMMLMLYLEMITDWLIILLNSVKCLPLMIGLEIERTGGIDEVDYADIVNEQNIPESSSEC